MTRPGSYDYDIAILSDFRYPGGSSVSVAEEIQVQAAAGYSTVLVPVRAPHMQRKRGFNTRIISCVQSGLADLAAPDQALKVRALVIRHPRALDNPDPSAPIPKVQADIVVMIANQPHLDPSVAGDDMQIKGSYYDPAAVNHRLHELFGSNVLWAPIGPLVRSSLEQSGAQLEISSGDWYNVFDADEWRAERNGHVSDRPVIGRHSRPHWHKWPSSALEILEAYPADDAFEVKILGGGEVPTQILGQVPSNWTLYPFGSVHPRRFLREIDFWVYYHHPDWVEAFGRTIAEALASACPTVVPPHFQPLFKDACIYAEPGEVQDIVRRLYDDPVSYREQAERGHAFVKENFGHGVHRRRLEALIGEPSRPGRVAGKSSRPRSIIFFTANGEGMGHLSRMMAIANRLPETIRPTFVTPSLGMRVVREAGYFCEYIPQVKAGYWHDYLQQRLEEIIRRDDAQGLVFDGTYPFRGLMRVRETTGLPFAWVRRGMWRRGEGEEHLEFGKDFDYVIEPGEFAEPYDEGFTTQLRDDAICVPPIMLLDEKDLLQPDEAKAELGLDPSHQAALIYLGAGNTYDLGSPAMATVERLLSVPDLDVAFVDSVISRELVELPPGVKRLQTYPVSRYSKAFDFAVSSAGYNSFHELVGFGVPTIFVPVETKLDDQSGRARFAKDVGAGLTLDPFNEPGLEWCLEQILSPEKRDSMAAKCRELFPGNGAGEAASAVARLFAQPLAHGVPA